jgi:hypothetical protein
MKSRIVPTACGVLAFAGLVGLFGHTLTVSAPQAEASTNWQEEKAALIESHQHEISKFTTSLDAANRAAQTAADAEENAQTRLEVACARLVKANITIAECRQ